MTPDLKAKIDKFLAEKKQPVGTGWPEVRPDEMIQLHEIVHKIVEEKWERDVDGDLPLNWELIDRTQYGPMHFRPVQYSHLVKTKKEKLKLLDAHINNLQIAAENVRMCSRLVEE